MCWSWSFHLQNYSIWRVETAVCSHGLFICLRIAGTLFLDPFLGLSIFLILSTTPIFPQSQSPSPSINPSKTLTLSTSMFAILLLGRRRHFLRTARRVACSSQENAALNGGWREECERLQKDCTSSGPEGRGRVSIYERFLVGECFGGLLCLKMRSSACCSAIASLFSYPSLPSLFFFIVFVLPISCLI